MWDELITRVILQSAYFTNQFHNFIKKALNVVSIVSLHPTDLQIPSKIVELHWNESSDLFVTLLEWSGVVGYITPNKP